MAEAGPHPSAVQVKTQNPAEARWDIQGEKPEPGSPSGFRGRRGWETSRETGNGAGFYGDGVGGRRIGATLGHLAAAVGPVAGSGAAAPGGQKPRNPSPWDYRHLSFWLSASLGVKATPQKSLGGAPLASRGHRATRPLSGSRAERAKQRDKGTEVRNPRRGRDPTPWPTGRNRPFSGLRVRSPRVKRLTLWPAVLWRRAQRERTDGWNQK